MNTTDQTDHEQPSDCYLGTTPKALQVMIMIQTDDNLNCKSVTDDSRCKVYVMSSLSSAPSPDLAPYRKSPASSTTLVD